MNLEKQDYRDVVENAMTWIVVFAMYIYGFGKIIQFDGAADLEVPVSELTGMQLMWAFYGYSQTFAIILGIIEVLGGTLLLIKKTRLLGCFVVSTVLINIILQDIVFGVAEGALYAAIIYQLIILVILWMNRQAVLAGLKALAHNVSPKGTAKKVVLKLGLAFVLFVLLRIGEYLITIG